MMLDTLLLIGILVFLIWSTYSMKRDIQTIRQLQAKIAELEARREIQVDPPPDAASVKARWGR